MTATNPECYEHYARQLKELLPKGPRVAVLGSTDFWHPESEQTCAEIGRMLADIPGLILITGGVEGVGEAVGRNFFIARSKTGQEPHVYHVLPEGEPPWDYGKTLFAGADMSERREVLGRLSHLYLLVEGGPGSKHEVEVASALGAIVIPVGRSGGFAGTLYPQVQRPSQIDVGTWNILGASESPPGETAIAVFIAVNAIIQIGT